ncbi:MAG: hypothetical protein E4H46_01045 [Desulfobacterales bacterium]|nr:MAG: hypothetical protein E4H46_01045 [Desulfobacterales bacterium]
MKRIYVKSYFVLLLIFLWLALPLAVQAQLPVNPQLTNGDFETSDLSGWVTGGTQNYSVYPVLENGNYMATLDVGEGPIGDQSCENPFFDNFAYLDQLFTISKNHCVEFDFRVPLPAISDDTENADCSGFDRVELDFVLLEQEPSYNMKMIGVVTIDYINTSEAMIGGLYVNDFVLGTSSNVFFNPTDFAPTVVGPLSLRESTALPGWLHASMDVSTSFFSWLPDQFTFRVTARLEDNRYTGQDFSLTVDNVQERPGPCGTTIVDIDIKPGSCPNPLNVGKKGVLPVAILGTEDFDVTTIDPASVRLVGVAPIRWAMEDVATPYEEDLEACDNCHEFMWDGYVDLILKLGAQEVVTALGEVEDGECLTLELTGNLKEEFGGTPIAGEDVMVILKKK